MRKSHRCIVPLRVPVVALTNKTENGKLKTENQLVLTFHLSPFTSHQGLSSLVQLQGYRVADALHLSSVPLLSVTG